MTTQDSKADSLEQGFIYSLHLALAIILPVLSIVILLTNVPNKIPPLTLMAILFSLAIGGLFFEKHRNILANAILIITLPSYVFIVFQNGLAPAVIAPFFVLVYLVIQNRGLMIAGTLVAVLCPLALYFTQFNLDIAVLSRISISSLFSAILFYFVTQKYHQLFNTLSESAKTNARIYGTIGHELRTPAASIDMLADAELEKHDVKNTLEIKKLSTQLLDVLDDMKVSRQGNEAVEQSMRFETASVFDTLERALSGVESMAQKHNIQLKLSGKRLTTAGHKTPTKAVFQVVQNLVKNAILHSGGTTVEVKFSGEAVDNQKTKFQIHVVDDGKGISQALQAKMFDAFVRGDSKSDGTGLGLNVCKQVASNIEGGEIKFRESPTHGSCFEFSFILEQVNVDETQTDKDSDSSTNALSGLKILLVEDSDMLRMLGRKLLEKNDAVVTEACDGFEALEILTDCKPDVVLTDIMMPNCNGYELTLELRKNGFEKPIIGVTGATVGQEAEQLIECGANAVLSKPLNFDALNEALLKHQNNRV